MRRSAVKVGAPSFHFERVIAIGGRGTPEPQPKEILGPLLRRRRRHGQRGEKQSAASWPLPSLYLFNLFAFETPPPRRIDPSLSLPVPAMSKFL